MKNKTVKMISSVVVLAVLCGAYFGVKTYVAKQEEQENGKEEAQTTNVLAVSSDDIKSLKFIIDKKEVIFEKDGDSWVKQDETTFPVSQDKLEEVVSAVSSLEASRVLENVEDLYEYGLDEPSNTITVTTEEGDETSIRVGVENESTNQYYVNKDDDRETVYVVNADTVEPFMKSLYDYAKMEEFPEINSANIHKVEVNEKNAFYTLDEDEDSGLWYISDGKDREKADSASASTLTSSVSGLEYTAFVDYNCVNKEDYGLDQPYAKINIYYNEEIEASDEETDTASDEAETENVSTDAAVDTEEDDSELEEKQLTIYIGDEAEDNTRYVTLNDSKQVYTISEESLSAFLGKDISDFWELTVSYLSINSLSQLKVNYDNQSHAFDVSRETSKDEDGEEQETVTYLLDGQEVDETLYTTFYNKLINMTGQRRLQEKYEGQEPAEMKVEFVDIDGNTIIVNYYTYDTNYYAAVVDEKTYLVNKMTVKEMMDSYKNIIEADGNVAGDEGIDADATEDIAERSEKNDNTDAPELASDTESPNERNETEN